MTEPNYQVTVHVRAHATSRDRLDYLTEQILEALEDFQQVEEAWIGDVREPYVRPLASVRAPELALAERLGRESYTRSFDEDGA